MRIQDVFLLQALNRGHGPQDGIERADSQWIVIRNRQPVMARGIRLENYMAALLIDAAIAVMFAEQLDQLRAAQVARQFHAPASNSSRTKCRRTAAGLGW